MVNQTMGKPACVPVSAVARRRPAFTRSTIMARSNSANTPQGMKLGRPRVAEKVEKAVLLELGKGHGIHTVARAVGVGTGTVQRIMRRAAVA